jgi:hypothetical protein
MQQIIDVIKAKAPLYAGMFVRKIGNRSQGLEAVPRQSG